MTAATTIRAYYDAFNAGDMDRFLALLTDDVAHDINQGGRQSGKAAFRDFLAHMDRCYRERLTDKHNLVIDEAGCQRCDDFGGQRSANQTSNVIGLDECIPVDIHVFRSSKTNLSRIPAEA